MVPDGEAEVPFPQGGLLHTLAAWISVLMAHIGLTIIITPDLPIVLCCIGLQGPKQRAWLSFFNTGAHYLSK